jgi:hypothetical protein
MVTQPPPRPHILLAFDPGNVHVGAAQYRLRSQNHYDVWAKELTPQQTIPWLWTILEHVAESPASSGLALQVAYESFRVRSGAPLGGSDLQVVQMIGAFEAIAQHYGIPTHPIPPPQRAVHLTRLSTRPDPWAGAGNHAHDAQAVGAAILGLAPQDYTPHRKGQDPPFAWPKAH